MPAFKDIAGQKFNRLTVIERYKDKSHQQGVKWICLCDCGNTKIISSYSICSGNTKSCGCFALEVRKKIHLKHGHANKILEYSIWKGMKTRCYNKNAQAYKNYGGRGIKVCNEWNNSFLQFFQDMGKRPTPKHTIERINNNMGYSPNNCKWIHKSKQNQNTRYNHFIKIDNQIKHLAAWLRYYKILPITYKTRVKRGWNKIDAITTPINTKYHKNS